MVNKIEACLQTCADWGLIPTAFRQCMTWEEQVLWLFKFLQQTVIPTLNDVIDEHNELSAAFEELKQYVDNYFDNLDIQAEVDNKLEEMAESGQLADIVAAYLQLQGVLAFNTVAEITNADNLVNGSFVKTYGYLRKGDGVYDIYKVRNILNTDVIDGYNIVSIAADPTLIAERLQYGKEVVVNLLGTDNLQDYLNIVGKKTIILPKNETLTFTDALFLNSDTTLDLNGATVNFDYLRPESFPLVTWDETFGFMSYTAEDSYLGYEGIKNVVIRDGTISQGCSCFMHAKNVTFENVEFVNAGSRHVLQIAACYNFTVKNCVFNGTKTSVGNENASECINIDGCVYGAQPYLDENNVTYDNTKNYGLVIEGNQFKTPTTQGYSYQAAVGTHGAIAIDATTTLEICENIRISNNNFGSPLWASIALSTYTNAAIFDNIVNCDAANPSTFISRYGNGNGIYIHDNILNNVTRLLSAGNTQFALDGLTISNNQIIALDPNNDSSAVIQMFNIKNATISNNNIKYQHHVAHLNSGDYWNGTSVGDDTNCVNIVFMNNVFEKTVASAVNFGAFRVAKTDGFECNACEFIHDAALQANYKDLAIQTGATTVKVQNNITDAPFVFVPVADVTPLFRNNLAYYSLLPTSPSYNARSGSGNFNKALTNFSKVVLQIGQGNNMKAETLMPYMPNGYTDGGKFDPSDRTWKVAVVKDDGTYGKVEISVSSSGVSFSWIGDAAIRGAYGMD